MNWRFMPPKSFPHALQVANHIDYLGGMPGVTPKPVKTSEKAEEMLRFDLENEKETIRQYRRRVKQADELNEFAGFIAKFRIRADKVKSLCRS
jgi:bacterioferritin (cytochrome b1)